MRVCERERVYQSSSAESSTTVRRDEACSRITSCSLCIMAVSWSDNSRCACVRERGGLGGGFESNVCTLYFALRIAKTAVQLCVVSVCGECVW